MPELRLMEPIDLPPELPEQLPPLRRYPHFRAPPIILQPLFDHKASIQQPIHKPGRVRIVSNHPLPDRFHPDALLPGTSNYPERIVLRLRNAMALKQPSKLPPKHTHRPHQVQIRLLLTHLKRLLLTKLLSKRRSRCTPVSSHVALCVATGKKQPRCTKIVGNKLKRQPLLHSNRLRVNEQRSELGHDSRV